MKRSLTRNLLVATKAFAFLLLLELIFQSSVSPQSANSEFLRVLLLADKRYQAGDFDGAIANYQQAVKLNAQSGMAYSGLGSVLLDKGNYKESAAALETAVALLEKLALNRNL